MNGKRIPSARFVDIISKTENLLSEWRSKLVSFAGKITLIKYNILAILIYLLAESIVPKVVDKIEKLMRNFLWDNKNEKEKFSPHKLEEHN